MNVNIDIMDIFVIIAWIGILSDVLINMLENKGVSKHWSYSWIVCGFHEWWNKLLKFCTETWNFKILIKPETRKIWEISAIMFYDKFITHFKNSRQLFFFGDLGYLSAQWIVSVSGSLLHYISVYHYQ